MSANLPSIIQEMMRQNVSKQLSIIESISEKFFNASLQFANLNRQASVRLLEESAEDVRKALQIQTIGDVQSFIGEQSKMSVEKIRGYWQNVQNISIGTWANPADDQAAAGAELTTAFEEVSPEQQLQHAEKAHGHNKHDIDPHPSPLMEKLVASIADKNTPSNVSSE